MAQCRDVTLPNAHLAIVDRSKVIDYLLCAAHPDNGGKARFFGALGYSADRPERLVAALCDVARDGTVVEAVHSAYGEKYVVDGWLAAQTEETSQRLVRSVWIVERHGDAPRLVTAYPGKE